VDVWVGTGVDVLVGVAVGGGVDVPVAVAVGGTGALVGGRSVAVGDTYTLSCSVSPQLTMKIRMIIAGTIDLASAAMFSLLPFAKMLKLLRERHSKTQQQSLCKRFAPAEKKPIPTVVPEVRFFL
jgi:hypothetical protein